MRCHNSTPEPQTDRRRIGRRTTEVEALTEVLTVGAVTEVAVAAVAVVRVAMAVATAVASAALAVALTTTRRRRSSLPQREHACPTFKRLGFRDETDRGVS